MIWSCMLALVTEKICFLKISINASVFPDILDPIEWEQVSGQWIRLPARLCSNDHKEICKIMI